MGCSPQRCYHCGKYSDEDLKKAKKNTENIFVNLLIYIAISLGVIGAIFSLADGNIVPGLLVCMLLLVAGVTGMIRHNRSEERRILTLMKLLQLGESGGIWKGKKHLRVIELLLRTIFNISPTDTNN